MNLDGSVLRAEVGTGGVRVLAGCSEVVTKIGSTERFYILLSRRPGLTIEGYDLL